MGNHLIHRQVLELRYSDERKAKTAINEWGERFQNDWIPIIEEALDELDQVGKWIRLDCVAIDLGSIRENLTPDLIRKKLKEILIASISREIPRFENENSNSLFTQDEGKEFELLVYLLLNGRKPWWASQSEKEGIRNLCKQLISEKNTKFLSWLRSGSFTPSMLSRLKNHLEKNEISEILSLTFPEKLQQSVNLFQSLISSLSPEVHSGVVLEKILEIGIMEAFFISENQVNNPVSMWIKVELLGQLGSKTSSTPSQEALTKLLVMLIPPGMHQKSKVEKVWAKWIQTPVYKKAARLNRNQMDFGKIEKTNLLESLKNEKIKKELDARQKLGGKLFNTTFSKSLITDETLLISNSGLVLAAPFLPFFFKGLGLVENKQFISPGAQNRAALLLQAMLDDSFYYEESDVLLNKILCGISPSEPIEVSFSPTIAEKEEINNLLNSMASRWTALKSTSGTSMARGFFPREGSLKQVNQGYELKVPRHSIDILLNRLPWTISIIKLPWMNETLFTEW